MALLYWPGGEFMYLVLTTSTGEAITVVTKPAPNADTKWHGRLSVGGRGVESSSFVSAHKQSNLNILVEHIHVGKCLSGIGWGAKSSTLRSTTGSRRRPSTCCPVQPYINITAHAAISCGGALKG